MGRNEQGHESIGFLVNDVARLIRKEFNRRAEGFGLSQAQWRVLAYLSRQEGVNQVTLADSLEIQPISLARQIDKLEEAGVVVRKPDPDDRRAVRLYLTPVAEPLLDQMRDIAGKVKTDAMKGMSESEQAALREALQLMKANLGCGS